VTREEALKLANIMITEWVGEKTNQRGYVHDKWQPTDLVARTEATVKLAAFLMTPLGPLVAPAPVSRETPGNYGPGQPRHPIDWMPDRATHEGHAPSECPGPPECL
jgi:hypothetical protein